MTEAVVFHALVRHAAQELDAALAEGFPVDPASRLAQSGAKRRRLALEQVHSARRRCLRRLDEARAPRRRVDAPLAVEVVLRSVREELRNIKSDAARADDGDARADFDAPDKTSAYEWTRTFFEEERPSTARGRTPVDTTTLSKSFTVDASTYVFNRTST